jgi:hypothetical protein
MNRSTILFNFRRVTSECHGSEENRYITPDNCFGGQRRTSGGDCRLRGVESQKGLEAIANRIEEVESAHAECRTLGELAFSISSVTTGPHIFLCTPEQTCP